MYAYLRNLPILAKATAEITAYSCDRKTARAGEKVIQWFLFDRVNMQRDRFAVGMRVKDASFILSNPAGAKCTVCNPALMAAQKTMHKFTL
jgi:hypothetical protein